MGGPLSAAEVHKQYDEAVSAFRRQIGEPALRLQFGREADPFLRKCALGVWHADGGAITPGYVEYYEAVYCKGNPVPSTLFWELSTAVGEYPGFVSPAFFARLRAYDRQTGQALSRRFVDTFTLMLLLFAAVDGVVSEREAAFVNKCADGLTALCDRDGVAGGKTPLDVRDFITRKPEGPPPTPMAQAEGAGAAEAGDAASPAEPEPSLEELLAELDSLCGLEKVKADVKNLINLVKVRKLREENGLPVPPMSLHLVFMGNPGTGKTTVARLLAKIYHAVGVLSKGQLVEVDRSGLVAGFVGQTALKTTEVIQKALGGVLFIDEAYALSNQDSPNDFGREAIEVILKMMEDNRKDLIVIVAGYTELMGRFISSNPGLESRFNKYFYFEDYNGGQLMEIFSSMCDKNGYTMDEETRAFAAAGLTELYEQRDENFGNARDVRNVFERAVARQANRLAVMEHPDKDSLMALTVSDLEEE
ncbi:hypothetical protein SDC9_65035 [bioreactor metagenome]|uniref:AAA+ ATPase domain-containing protein n=1 Tax=bioreactor metagenome TaxID=1076179 RepID=A0A644XQV9_9ZZZZ